MVAKGFALSLGKRVLFVNRVSRPDGEGATDQAVGSWGRTTWSKSRGRELKGTGKSLSRLFRTEVGRVNLYFDVSKKIVTPMPKGIRYSVVILDSI